MDILASDGLLLPATSENIPKAVDLLLQGTRTKHLGGLAVGVGVGVRLRLKLKLRGRLRGKGEAEGEG